MARLSKNENATREMVKDISVLTDLDPKIVETVLLAQELHIQHQTYSVYKDDPEDPPEIELPYLGTLKMFPIIYKRRDDIKGNAATRVKFYPTENFKTRLRKSMYQDNDFLADHTLKSFKDHLIGRFKSLI